jgi:betaine-aldehyde dehydrogenase
VHVGAVLQAGLPAGALNVVTGMGPDAGGPLSAHPGIDKISFTGNLFGVPCLFILFVFASRLTVLVMAGSVPTARRVMGAAAAGPRAISLELGGKSPLVIFDDAVLDAAVDWVLTGFLWGSGQVRERVDEQNGVSLSLSRP